MFSLNQDKKAMLVVASKPEVTFKLSKGKKLDSKLELKVELKTTDNDFLLN